MQVWNVRIGQVATIAGLAVIGAAAYAGDCDPVWDMTMGDPGIGEGYVADFTVYDDGQGGGAQLFAAGSFGIPNGGFYGSIAQWNGEEWLPVGDQLDNWATEMAVFQGELYVGGYFNFAGGVPGTDKIAKWNGTEWSGIGAQLELWSSAVWSLQVFDDGSGEALYIGGNFTDIGGTGIDHIARWDGTSFSEVGGTIVSPLPLLKSFQIYDDGSGPALYAGGRFTSIGGVPANYIAKWNGTTWEALGTGLAGGGAARGVHDMVVFDDGDGPALIAGGHSFTSAGGVPALRIAKWDGAEWHAMGDGFDGTVDGLAVYDDGSGPALYATGAFTHSGATEINYFARWNGMSWDPVGTGLDDNAFALFDYDGGAQSGLCIGGTFTAVDGQTANQVAQFIECGGGGIPGDVNNDGFVNVDDLFEIINNWGPCDDPGDCPADLNDDTVVNIDDLMIVLNNWG